METKTFILDVINRLTALKKHFQRKIYFRNVLEYYFVLFLLFCVYINKRIFYFNAFYVFIKKSFIGTIIHNCLEN